MENKQNISYLINKTENELNKLRFIYSKFPDIIVVQSKKNCQYELRSGKTCKIFSNLEFLEKGYNLYVIPCYHLNYNDEINKIYSFPVKNIKLAEISYIKNGDVILYEKGRMIIVNNFSKLIKRFKFNEIHLNECRKHILNFIRKNSYYRLSEENLDIKIKQLLMFV